MASQFGVERADPLMNVVVVIDGQVAPTAVGNRDGTHEGSIELITSQLIVNSVDADGNEHVTGVEELPCFQRIDYHARRAFVFWHHVKSTPM